MPDASAPHRDPARDEPRPGSASSAPDLPPDLPPEAGTSVDAPRAEAALARVLGLMAALRTPGSGCPWDLEQTFATIAPYTLEEAYEVADAIERGDLGDLREELGDLLLQVVFHARMAEEAGAFDFAAVAGGLADKLVRRHPHVFGPNRFGPDRADAAADVEAIWSEAKRREAEAKRAAAGVAAAAAAPSRALAGVPVAMPALVRAEKLSRKAARVGFDWADAGQVLAKVREEVDEVEGAMGDPHGDPGALAEEIGDLLFAAANLARHVGVDAEAALRRANAKFQRRFEAVEDALAAAGHPMPGTSLAVMEAAWAAVKRAERDGEADPTR